MSERLYMLMDHLELAEERIALGKWVIAKRRALRPELERDGHCAEMAEKLLVQFEELQAMNIADRNRIRAELAELKP